MDKYKNLFLIFIFLCFLIFVGFKIAYLDKVFFLCPIKYNKEIIIRNDVRGNGNFGVSRNGNRKHKGIDFGAGLDTEVAAARSGEVIETGFHKGLGIYVQIQHDNMLTTIYGHLNRAFVSQGQLVRQGQLIGLVGKTGNAGHPKILPHLHFEVWERGNPVDPMGFLE